MADVTITVNQVTAAGTSASFTAVSNASDAFYMANDERSWLEVNNASASPITVTVTAVGSCNQGFLHDQTITIAASTIKKIGYLDRGRFNQAGGNVKFTFSAATSVTYAGFRI